MFRYNPKEPRSPEVSKDEAVSGTKEPTAGTKPPDDRCYINKQGLLGGVVNVGNHYRCQEGKDDLSAPS